MLKLFSKVSLEFGAFHRLGSTTRMLEILHYQVTTNQKHLVITNKKQKDVFEYAKLSPSNANGSKFGTELITFI